MQLIADGHPAEGLGKLTEATRLEPENAALLKERLVKQRQLIDRTLADAALQRGVGRLDAAEVLYRQVFELEPNNAVARQALQDLELARRHEKLLDESQTLVQRGESTSARTLITMVLMENPSHARAKILRGQLEDLTAREQVQAPSLNVKGRKPLTLQFRDASLKIILEAIARTTGLNILLDKDVRGDTKVSIFVKDSPVDEALELLMVQNQLERRVLGESTVLIYPANAAKARDFQDLKVRRFALLNADAKQVQTMLKTIVKVRDIFVDEKTNSVIIRDTPDAVRLAERLVMGMDQPEPEVMLEIDIMQVDRNRMLELGIDWTKSFTWSLRDKMTLQDFKNRTAADVNISGLSVTATASKTDGDVNDLATPRIRVRNKEKAKILVGTRNPVVSSAATPAPTGGDSTVYNTNVTYVETGIKLEVEPQIHPDGEVAIKLNLEVSSAGAQVDTGPSGTVVFPVNTNNIATLLQLRDGETQIMGGLLQRQSDQSQTKIPGLGDIPILGRLFGATHDTWNRKELLLAITPRIVRNVNAMTTDIAEMWSGTESRLRFGPANLKAAGGGGVLGMTGTGADSSSGAPSASQLGVPVARPLGITQPTPAVGAVVPTPAPQNTAAGASNVAGSGVDRGTDAGVAVPKQGQP